MAGIFAFKCSCCDEIHEGSPSFGYDAPWHYSMLSDEDKKTIATLTSDLCKIQHPEQTDYFARTVLEVPIIGVEEPFTWGVWVSLSEKSYNQYIKTYDNPIEGDSFFGRVCNRLPYYPDTLLLPVDVFVGEKDIRPSIRLHQTDVMHVLVQDQIEGITIEKAQEIAEYAMHRS